MMTLNIVVWFAVCVMSAAFIYGFCDKADQTRGIAGVMMKAVTVGMLVLWMVSFIMLIIGSMGGTQGLNFWVDK